MNADPDDLNARAVALLGEPLTGADPAALSQAVGWLERALVIAPKDAAYLTNLSLALRLRFDRSGNLPDLAAAVTAAQQSVHAFLSSDGDPADDGDRADDGLAGALANLGGVLCLSYQHSGSAADLDAAVAAGRQAVSRLPANSARGSPVLTNICGTLCSLFEHTGDLADLAAAVVAGERAVQGAASDDPDRTIYLSNLACALELRFRATDDVGDLDAAITYCEQAVQAAPAGDPRLVMFLVNLGEGRRNRYDRRGHLDDLEAAITIAERLVAEAPVDHPNRAVFLSSLAIALQARADRTGSLTDVDAGIALAEQAVAAAPTGQAHRIKFLSNLGMSLLSRFERTGDPADLDAAIAATDEAVREAPANHVARAGMLINLGSVLLARYGRTAQLADLEAGIECNEQAVAATAVDDPGRPTYLAGLGAALSVRFERTDDVVDIDAAIAVTGQAAATAAMDRPDRAGFLTNLGYLLVMRYVRTRDLVDLTDAAVAYREALHHPTAAPSARAMAGGNAANLAAEVGDLAAAAADLAVVIMLLPLVVDRALSAEDRQYHLRQLGAIGTHAARAALGRIDRDDGWPIRVASAWQHLERARNILLNQAMEAKAATEGIEQASPDLAAEYQQLRAVLATGGVGGDGPSARAHREALARWPTLLTEIRLVPGCENFALPPPMPELHAAAGDGTVIAVLVTTYGSGALILTRTKSDYVALPGLTGEAAVEQTNAFIDAVNPDEDEPVDADAMHRVLRWLWDAVVEPILLHVDCRATPSAETADWPRVWWIPTGPLASLPLHAAGYHDDPAESRRTVLDRVVSSYAPSVRALAAARGHGTPSGDVLAVGIEETSDLPPLRWAEREAISVARILGRATTLLGPAATHDAVTAQLARSAWAHFACHGLAYSADPSQSFLVLRDELLMVRELFELRLENPYLVYLSACTTGSGSLPLLDENLHIASAFQLAGYPHVVATLWPINDFAAAEYARDIYTAIHPDPDTWVAPALALHDTTRAHRDSHPRHPFLWASHVHFGP